MKYALFALVITFFMSCSGDKEVDFVAKNEIEITEYIAKNNLNAQKTDTGLYYVISEAGSGAQPTAASTVTVAYKGYYTDGTVFDQSNSSGSTFPLQNVIKGWTEGIPYFKTGGSGILLIPAHLGYGKSDRSGIKGGSVLIFDIKLISVR